jgi:DNA topoisomerase III
MSRLILTEKPSVALTFAEVLKADRFMGCYKNRSGDVITYCWGHLLRLFDPEEYDPNLSEWSLETLPIIPEEFFLTAKTAASRQLSIIRGLLLQHPTQIVIATDAGREGELIARETLKWCGLKDFSNVYRFWTSRALTPDVIEQTLRDVKLAEDFAPLYRSAYYRMLGDWLVGMNLSRLFTIKLHSTFSFGRVQIPVLAALADVSAKIKTFVPQPYFSLRLTLTRDQASFHAYYVSNDKISFPDRGELEKVLASLKLSQSKARAIRVHKEQKIVLSPQLYNLTSLQKDCNRFFGYRAVQTEQIAQDLYEQHKILSYPRSSSRVLSRSDQPLFCNVITQLNFHHPEIFRGCQLPTVDNARIFDDSRLSDHHALIILDKLPPTLTPEENNVAILILKSMASVLLSPYIYNLQTYDFDLDGKPFRARGNETVNAGWRQLFSQEHANADAKGVGHSDGEDHFDTLLLSVGEGELLEVTQADILDKMTKPPRPFTEATLLAFMEKHRLGTEATRSAIVEKLIKRRYAVRNKRLIVATDKGAFFIRTIKSLSAEHVKDFASVQETATWEAMLESAPETFYTSIKMSLLASVHQIKEVSLGEYQSKPVRSCPSCGKPVREAQYSYMCTSGNECRFRMSKIIAGHTLTVRDISALLSGSETRPAVFTKKTGQEFKSRLKYDPDTKTIVFSSPNHAKTPKQVGGSS